MAKALSEWALSIGTTYDREDLEQALNVLDGLANHIPLEP